MILKLEHVRKDYDIVTPLKDVSAATAVAKIVSMRIEHRRIEMIICFFIVITKIKEKDYSSSL